jgi:translation initiation factor 1
MNKKNKFNDYKEKEEASDNPFAGLLGIKMDLPQGEEIKEVKTSNKKSYPNQVRVWLEKGGRGGKEATVVKGMEDLSDDFLSEIAKKIKTKIGVGGTSKDGEIIIQGNHRDKVVAILVEEGFKQTKKAGG